MNTVIAVLLSTTIKNGFRRRCYREAIVRRGISLLRNGSTTRQVMDDTQKENHFDGIHFLPTRYDLIGLMLSTRDCLPPLSRLPTIAASIYIR